MTDKYNNCPKITGDVSVCQSVTGRVCTACGRAVFQYNGTDAFPSLGNTNALYIDTSAKPYTGYTWDPSEHKYQFIGAYGKSAYDIACKNGFSGTEEQWLKSLRGDDGVSVTHSWSGTTLSITSASGTSSANLKGEAGKDAVFPSITGLIKGDGKGGGAAAVAGKDYAAVQHNHTKSDIADFPSALPNPNKLNFTGALSASYDGSKAVSVKIPLDEISIGASAPTGDETIWIDTSEAGIIVDPAPAKDSSNLITSGAVYAALENTGSSLLDFGVTASAEELNLVSGAASNIQTQLNSKATSDHTHNYAGSSSSGGSAASAVKLDSSAGSATQPVYFSGGKPVATTYTLGKSVPSDAVFTDTEYTHPSYTARTGVPTANATPAFGGTFSVSQPVSDAAGHITALNSRTVKIPNTAASTSTPGLMSADDKAKLDAYPPRTMRGANANEVYNNTFYYSTTGFSAGQSITVSSDWRKYSLFLITLSGHGTVVLAVKYSSFLRGVGGFAASSSSNTTIGVACTHTQGSTTDTITCVNSTAAITSIVGLI